MTRIAKTRMPLLEASALLAASSQCGSRRSIVDRVAAGSVMDGSFQLSRDRGALRWHGRAAPGAREEEPDEERDRDWQEDDGHELSDPIAPPTARRRDLDPRSPARDRSRPRRNEREPAR